MHAADLLIFALALAAGLGVFVSVYRGTDRPTPLAAALASFAGLAAALTSLEIAALWLAQTGDPWNNARLTPAIALHYGFRLYYPLHEGPVLSTVVGPMAFLAYWPIGFIRGSPTTLILAASALNLLVCAALLAALVRRLTQDRAMRVLVALVGAQLALSYPSLRYSLFCIHADAPALLLGGLGAGLVIFDRTGLAWNRCLAAALCLTLAVWAKQSLAPIFLALVAVAALHHGARGTARFVVASAVVGAAISGFFVTWIGYASLRDNMFVVPAGHPWRQMSLTTGEVFDRLTAVGAVAHAKVLAAASLHIVRESWFIFAALFAALAEHLLRSRPGRRWPRRAWAALLVVAVMLLPTAAIGRAKLGGEINHESFVVFFLLAAFVCWLASIAQEQGRPLLGRIAAVLAVLVAINAPRVLEYPGWKNAWDNQNEAAYRYDERHPGKIFFPWNPLTSLLAEGKLYHFDYGVFDRNLGGARISSEQLAQYLPAPHPVIACFTAHHNHILRTYFPDHRERPAVHELLGWKTYGPHMPPRVP
jgi:hypothetical protein